MTNPSDLTVSLPPPTGRQAHAANQAPAPGQAPGPSVPAPPLDDAAAARVVAEYVAQATALTGESARSRLLAGLLDQLFGLRAVFVEECLPDTEAFVRVRHKDRAVLGQPGQFFGNVIIDMEDDLGRAGRGDEARLQLRRYLSCFWTKEPAGQRRRYLCLATDGLRFELYSPRAPEPGRPAIVPGELRLRRLDMVDARDPDAAAGMRRWLDRFFCRRERLAPTPGAFLEDLGAESHAFHLCSAELAGKWAWLSGRPDCAACFEAWQRSLAVSRAAPEAPVDAFVRHTYLALIARLAAWSRAGGAAGIPDLAAARAVLHGRAFRERGVAGLLDEPFFPWLLRPEAGDAPAALAVGLAGLLDSYDLDETAPAGLTALVQQLGGAGRAAAPEATPAWLAAAAVDRLVGGRPDASILDPACGAGAFLCQAIRRKRDSLGDSAETLAHIQETVAGLDADPLAVIVSQAAYLLALGSLANLRAPSLAIPVYHADALRPTPLIPEEPAGPGPAQRPRPPAYKLDVDGQTVHLPQFLAADPRRCRDGVEAAWQFAVLWQGRATESDFAAYLWPARPDLAADAALRAALFALTEDLRRTDLVDRGAQGLQSLQSAYGPLLLRGRFDLVATAPPRLALGDLPDGEYAARLRDLAARAYRLGPARDDALFALDLAPLFLVQTAALYLRPGGAMGGLLPRGVINAPSQDLLRRQALRGAPVRWTELWDLEGMTPHLRRPSCVLFGKTGGAADEAFPAGGMPGQAVGGDPPRGLAVRYYLAVQGRHTVWSTTRAVQPALGF